MERESVGVVRLFFEGDLMPWPKGVPRSVESVAKRTATLLLTGGKRRQPNADGLLRCPTCARDLPPSEFHADKRSPSRLRSQCKCCHGEGAVRTRDLASKRRKGRIYEADRRARARGQGGRVTDCDIARLVGILGKSCLRCGADKSIQWDHVVPLAFGGPHHPSNLQPLCRKCNERKQARVAEYRTAEQLVAISAVWVIGFSRVTP